MLLATAGAPLHAADEMTVKMHQVSKHGVTTLIGEVVARETRHGVVFEPDLRGLEPGLHGFHVHENADCAPGMKDGEMKAAMAAGGHLDPHQAGKHGAPWGEGHLGDLPALYVDGQGNASHPLLAPRLKLADLEKRSLMVHAGGDNYADQPKPMGGGGERIACGLFTSR